MLADPRHWAGYYDRDAADLRMRLAFSFSDRCRYYWSQPGPAAAVARLLLNLSRDPAPLALLSQFLPLEVAAVRDRALAPQPAALIRAHIDGVLDLYRVVCGDA